MLNNKRTSVSCFCECVGMLFITTALAASVAVLAATLYKKDRDSDYQERLREAYDGLSPDGGEY